MAKRGIGRKSTIVDGNSNKSVFITPPPTQDGATFSVHVSSLLLSFGDVASSIHQQRRPRRTVLGTTLGSPWPSHYPFCRASLASTGRSRLLTQQPTAATAARSSQEQNEPLKLEPAPIRFTQQTKHSAPRRSSFNPAIRFPPKREA